MSSEPSILDSSAISGCYLFPQPRSVKDPFIVQINDVELACYHRIVDPSGYTAVHFHGNGEAVADYVPDMTDELASVGLNSLLVEYRQYGGSTGKAQLGQHFTQVYTVRITLQPPQIGSRCYERS